MTNLKTTYSAGGIVRNRKGYILLIHEDNNFWGLPKGRIEQGEDRITAAVREIYEEAGLSGLSYIAEIGTYQRHPLYEGKDVMNELKTITLFLFQTSSEPEKTNSEGNKYRWVLPSEASALLTHPKDREFLREHVIPLLHSRALPDES